MRGCPIAWLQPFDLEQCCNLSDTILSCRKLALHQDDWPEDLWSTPFDAQTSREAGLTLNEAGLWAGPSILGLSSKSITIRNTQFRTESSEKNMKTCDSGICATFLTADGENKLVFGILQNIIAVKVGGREEILLYVKWYKECLPCPSIRGTWWVKTSGRHPFMAAADAVISAAKIDGQVFFAPDPQRTGYAHVFAYKGSSFVVPDHHYSADGRLLDLSHARPIVL